MVAAATTSLPERAEAGRNYDYRYVWIRDQCYAGQAGAAIDSAELMAPALRFVTERILADGPQLKPGYTTRGESIPDQRHLSLPGYPGGFDIVGNWVNGQFQLDVFGEALLFFAAAAKRDHMDEDGIRAAEVAAEAIRDRWREPDAGIWELDNKHWTHSKLTVAAGLRAAAAAMPHLPGASDWIILADSIVTDTARKALHHQGYWQRCPTDAGLDAALLLPGLRGAVPSDDPRTSATLAEYLDTLTHEGYAYRFRHGNLPLNVAEGSFVLCGFLTALALHTQGDAVAARGWFEQTRAACGPPELFSEEYDAEEHQMRGNMPQAFVHALLVESAARLADGGR
jgi:GH15 family glucan-1,4-alpha-glucosidase